MKHKIIIILMILFVVLFIIYLSTIEIGPGTAFEFRVIQGCDLIEGKGYNFTFTDEILDGMVIEHGYAGTVFTGPRYQREKLRNYCMKGGQNIEECLQYNRIRIFNNCNKP